MGAARSPTNGNRYETVHAELLGSLGLLAWCEALSEHDGLICGIALTPLEDMGGEVANQISELVASGELTDGLGNALTKRFEKALEKLNQGNAGAATDMLDGLIDQITDLINDGQISAANGENLIALAKALLL